jgi:hypothetical protein
MDLAMPGVSLGELAMNTVPGAPRGAQVVTMNSGMRPTVGLPARPRIAETWAL